MYMKDNERSIVEISITEAHNIILALSNKSLEIKSIFATVVFAFLGVSFFSSENTSFELYVKFVLVGLLFMIMMLFLTYYLRTSYFRDKWRLLHDKRVKILANDAYEDPFSSEFFKKVTACDVIPMVIKKSKFSIVFFILLFAVCAVIVFMVL